MKSFSLLPLLFFASGAVAQVDSTEITIPVISEADTVTVWVVYMDSVLLFSADPNFRMDVKVEPGWEVVCRCGGIHCEGSVTYFDTNGIMYNPEMVLFTKPRKPKLNRWAK